MDNATIKIEEVMEWAKTLNDKRVFITAVLLVGNACRRAEAVGYEEVASLCRRFVNDMAPLVGLPPAPKRKS